MKKIELYDWNSNTWDLVDPTETDIIEELFFNEVFFRFPKETTDDDINAFMEYINDLIQNLEEDNYNKYINMTNKIISNEIYCFDDGKLDSITEHKARYERYLKYWNEWIETFNK